MSRVSVPAVRTVLNPEAETTRRTARHWLLGAFATTAVALALAPAAQAQSLVLQGDYLKIGVNDKGTLGTGGTTRPGILYDGTGTGTFNPNYDYLTPGSPMEGFVLVGSTSGGAFTATNSNASLGSAQVTGTLTDYSGVAHGGETFDQRAVWTGTYGSTLGVTHDYRFNSNGQQLQIVTTITAMTDITGLKFVRFTDPDAVAAPGDTSATNNFQGNGSVAGTDLIYAEATVSKYVIGLYSNDPTPHVTGAPGFTAAPAGYLAGTFLGNGDYTIGMAFTYGDLMNGASLTLNYSYIFGTDISAAISANGGGGGGGSSDPTTPRNIEAGGEFSDADLAGGTVNPVFDGGSLKLTADTSVGMDFRVTANGGSIDTAGHDLVLSGVVAGEGRLIKTGEGVLELKGVNTFKGVTVNQGVLAIGADTALGAEGADLVINSGTIRSTGDSTILRKISLSGASATFDTQDHDLVISSVIDGGGVLEKVGTGVLTLSGENTYTGDVAIRQGTLKIDSAKSLGASTSTIIFAADTILTTPSNLILSNRINIDSGLGAIDVAGDSLKLDGALTGAGGIVKTGAGTLTLSGPSSLKTIKIDAGTVIASSQQALGASDGAIILAGGTRLVTGTDMAVTQTINFAGANAVIDTGAANITLTGAISGDNCLIKAGAGSLNLLAPGANAIGACVQEGALKFNSVFTGNVRVDANGLAAGSGLIKGDVKVAGILAPGNSPGRLVVDGSVALERTGTLLIDIDGPTAGVGAGHFDTLVLTGRGSVFTAAGAISPITRGITGDATNTYTPRIGDAFQVVTAEGGVTGRFDRLVQPAQGMPTNSRFEVVYRPNAVILAVTPDRYAAIATGVANAQAVAGAVDTLRDGGSTGFSDGLIGLNEGQLSGVLHQAAGEIHADTVEAVLRGARGARRLAIARTTAATADREVWASFSGGTREVGADDVAGRYRDDRVGLVVGADRRISDTIRLGGAVSYGEAEIKAGQFGAGRTFSYQAMAYAGWTSGPMYVSGVVQGGKDVYKTQRVLGATTLLAKPEGASYAIDVEAGRTFALAPANVTVIAGLSKDRVDRDGVTEAGSATLGLSFDDVKRDAVQARLGLRAERQLTIGQATLKPYVSAFALQELDGSRTRLDAALQGAGFEVASSSPGRTALELSTGFEAKVGARGLVRLGYRYEGAREAQAHAFSLTGAVAF
ncbi:MAG: hypothetical protein DI570_19500 [Phenylobacterium zucineum]|nr:MAG: hypothetical protein DI570_19500 [Phenylobacterium zucineum]